MTEPQKPADYVYDDVEVGPQEAVVHNARTRATQLTKGALKWYLEQYFSDDGRYRDQIRELCPYAVFYETRLSGSANADDPTIHDLQISRLWAQTKMRFPCFIIMESGFTPNSVGFGGGVEAVNMGDYQGFGLRMDATIPITIEVAATDEATATDLRDTLVLIFTALTHTNRSHLLRPAQPASWEARLPLRIESQGVDRRSFPNGNNLDMFWTTTVTLEIAFEGVAVLAFPHPKGVVEHSQDVTYDPDFEPADTVSPSLELDVHVPDTVYLGHRTRIHAMYTPFGSRFLTDNPNILRVYGETLLPRKLGTCNILLVDSLSNLIRSYPITIVCA